MVANGVYQKMESDPPLSYGSIWISKRSPVSYARAGWELRAQARCPRMMSRLIVTSYLRSGSGTQLKPHSPICRVYLLYCARIYGEFKREIVSEALSDLRRATLLALWRLRTA